MKNLKQLVLLCFFSFLVFNLSAAPFSPSAPSTPISTEESVMDAEELLAQLDREVMEEKLGRKLRLGERIVVKMMQRKIKKKIKKGKTNDGSLGLVSVILSSIGLFFLLMGFLVGVLFYAGILLCLAGFIVGLVGRKQEGDSLSTIGFALGLAGFVLGVVLIGLFVALIIGLG